MNRNLLRASCRGAVALAGTGLLIALTPGLASAAQDLCVSTNGTVRVQMGTATCSSVAGRGNVAIARGTSSSATAGFSDGDQHNRARASGDNSLAFAGIGSGNTATATGDGSFASAALGNGNTATASGTDSGATAEGTNQTAIASGVSGSAGRPVRREQHRHRRRRQQLRQRQRRRQQHRHRHRRQQRGPRRHRQQQHRHRQRRQQLRHRRASATTTPPSPARPTAPRSRRVAGPRTAARSDVGEPGRPQEATRRRRITDSIAAFRPAPVATGRSSARHAWPHPTSGSSPPPPALPAASTTSGSRRSEADDPVRHGGRSSAFAGRINDERITSFRTDDPVRHGGRSSAFAGRINDEFTPRRSACSSRRRLPCAAWRMCPGLETPARWSRPFVAVSAHRWKNWKRRTPPSKPVP